MPRDIPASPIQEDGLASAATHNRPPFVSLLAQVPQRVRLLTHLHQRAVETTGGRCSLLFEHNARNGGLQATSGFGLDNLQTDTWRPNAAEGELVSEAFANGAPLFVSNADSRMPELASRLGTDTALLLPLLQGGRRVGLLAVGFDDPTPALGGWERAAEAADSLVTALELFRLRRNEELQRALRQLVDDVSANLTMTLDLRAGLHVFCTRATPLFGADRTCVWLLDRRSRNLSLQAASDGANPDLQIDVDESLLPAAAALRSHRAEIQLGPGDMPMSTISVPLRGRRRALGTIVFEGVRIETGSEVDLLERADELGLQLSGAIENLQLLQDVIRSRRELENTFDSIAHLVVVTDRQGTIVHANRAFAERLGLARADVVERPLTECIGPELAAWLSSFPATEHQPAATLEVVDPMLKGPFMVTVTDLLDRDGHSTGRVLIARDLTPQSRLEVEREELRKRLTQSEKLAALGQFVAGIAHELNNPLQGVLGHLELLRATGAFPKQLRREVQTIYREADRAAKIVRNLLVFAGSRRLVKRVVSLPAVLQKVLALRAPALRALEIEVVRHYEDQLPRVQSDPLLLHQVFLNIVMNAEQAIAGTGRPGRIDISTRFDRPTARVVTAVHDSGPGISPDVLTRIFEPFYTTKDVGKGTGLGLAIAYGIMQEHGGHIAAANHPEGGAIFTVEVPASSGRSGTGRERHSAKDAEA